MPQGVAQHRLERLGQGGGAGPGRPTPTTRSPGGARRVGVAIGLTVPAERGQRVLRQCGIASAISRSCFSAWVAIRASAVGRERLGPGARARRLQDRVDRGDHRVHEQPGQHLQVGGGPVAQDGEAGDVGGQLGGEQPGLGADGVAQHGVARGPRVGHEGEVAAVLAHVGDQDLDRPRDQTGPGAPPDRPPEPRAASNAASPPTPRPARARARPCCRSGGRTRWARRPPRGRHGAGSASQSRSRRPSAPARRPAAHGASGGGARPGSDAPASGASTRARASAARRAALGVSTPVHATHVGVITDVLFALVTPRAYPLYRL